MLCAVARGDHNNDELLLNIASKLLSSITEVDSQSNSISSMSSSSSVSSNLFSPPIGVDTIGPSNSNRYNQNKYNASSTFQSYSNMAPASGYTTGMAHTNMNVPKSFQELKQQQRAPSSSSSSNASAAAAMAAGARLLSSRGIDTSSLFHKASNLESHTRTTSASVSRINPQSSKQQQQLTVPSTTTTATQKLKQQQEQQQEHLFQVGGGNIHSTLESIRLQSITNILTKYKESLKQKTQENIQNRIVRDWNMTRDQIIRDTVIVDENGRRIAVMNDGSSDTKGASDATTATMTTSNFSVSKDPKRLDEFYQFAFYHYSFVFDENSDSSTLASSSSSYRANRDATTLNNLMLKLTHDLSLSNPIYNPYQNATKLISTLSSPAASLSSSQFGQQQQQQQQQQLTNLATVKERTILSLVFLSNQFREYILAKVKNSTSSSNIAGATTTANVGGGFISYITRYVEMEIGHDVFLSGKRDVLFKCMYYSLRCGDVDTALEIYCSSRIVGSSGNGGGNSSDGSGGILKKVLEYLVQAGRDRNGGKNTDDKCIGLFLGLSNLSSSYISEMKELYHHAVLNANANSSSPNNNMEGEKSDYEVALLGMLSFSDVENNGVVTTTIEDYIYLNLWNSLSLECNMTDTLVSLGENIKSYGSDHFQDSGDGWAYAMPLLLCQCYKSGIVHLAQSGHGIGLCMGIHLAIALSNQKRIMIVDLIDEQRAANETTLVDKNNFVMSTLLISYAKALQSNAPAMALEYLIHIPDTTISRVPMKNGIALSQKAEKQICNLLLETKAFATLAGQVAPDGSRPASGALDIHFTPGGVSNLLMTAANDSTREGKIIDAAELLSLAGRYSTLLSLLNRKLASLVVVTKEDGMSTEKQQQRNIWRDAAHKFHNMYLSQGHSQVIQVLEAEGQLSLGVDFQLLLNLMVFFERCYDEKWRVSPTVFAVSFLSWFISLLSYSRVIL